MDRGGGRTAANLSSFFIFFLVFSWCCRHIALLDCIVTNPHRELLTLRRENQLPGPLGCGGGRAVAKSDVLMEAENV